MQSLPRSTLVILVLAVLALAAVPVFGETYPVQFVTKIMIMAILAMSLDLLVGYTGLISLGHAAFFGVAGYTLVLVTPEYEAVSLWLALPACLGAAAALALLIGWLSIRTSGIYFIMITLAFSQMLFYFFFDNPDLGGSDGIFIYFKPTVTLGETVLLDLENRTVFYYFVLALLVGAYVLLRTILRAPFGHVIVGIRANEQRMRALGYATRRYKLVAFIIAGTVAGLAGFLEAANGGFMNPSHLSWQESAIVLIMVILGGMGSLHGAVLGAFVLLGLQEVLGDLTTHWHLLLGLIVIGMVLALPDGLVGLAGQLRRRFGAGADAAPERDVEEKRAGEKAE